MQTVDRKAPKPLGHNLTEPIYEAVLKALDEEPARLDVLLTLLHPSDIADLLERLPIRNRPEVLHRVPHEVLADVIANVSYGVQENLLEEMTEDEVKNVLTNLDSDDVADIVQNMDDNLADQTLEIIPEIQQALLNYPEDTAGGIMQLEVISVPKSWTVDKLLVHLRQKAKDDSLPERFSTVCITDHTRKLLGTINLSRLVRIQPKELLGDVMRTDPVTVQPEATEKDVAQLFEKYDLFNCPVVDKNNRLLGVITIDDVLDVMMELHEKEIMQAAGLEEGEDLFAPLARTTQKRLPWLVINLFTAILASSVIALFEDAIAKVVALAVLMPIVASMGGNAGTQTMTVTVRGLAMRQITKNNTTILLRKELLVGTLNGLVLGILLGGGTFLVYRDPMMSIVICSAAIFAHFFAALAGITIPVILSRMKKDPAVSSGVFVTTVTDVVGFFAFLGLASLLLLK
ncbi:MAG: magnesium transporter [Proteobacteria bacterium]|nr:magnesium transporter [Pseudomonadota bacterium]